MTPQEPGDLRNRIAAAWENTQNGAKSLLAEPHIHEANRTDGLQRWGPQPPTKFPPTTEITGAAPLPTPGPPTAKGAAPLFFSPKAPKFHDPAEHEMKWVHELHEMGFHCRAAAHKPKISFHNANRQLE